MLADTTQELYDAMVGFGRAIPLAEINSKPGYNNSDKRGAVARKLSARFTKLKGAPVIVNLTPSRPYSLYAVV